MFRKFPIRHQLSTNFFCFFCCCCCCCCCFCLAILLKFFCSTHFAAAFFDNISRICAPLSSSEREEIIGLVFRLNKQIGTRIYREKERAMIIAMENELFSQQKVHRDTKQRLTTQHRDAINLTRIILFLLYIFL